MSLPNFESIIEGQLPPDEWYEYGLNTRFTLIEPNSGLGSMAIRLERELDRASDEFDRYREDLSGEDDSAWVIYEEEIDKTRTAFSIASIKRYVFKDIFRRTWQAYDPFLEPVSETRAKADTAGKSFYQFVVDRSIKEQLKESRNYPNSERTAVVEMIREAGLLYTLEEGVHGFETVSRARHQKR